MTRFELNRKKGLIIGIANQHSIAWGCARAARELGAELALTYLNDKARPHVEPLAAELGAALFCRCDVAVEAEVEQVFSEIEKHWGRLDFLIHSIAWAPLADLRGRLIDSSREGFLQAMDISCHSLMRLCKRAEPLLAEGGGVIAMSYLGAERVVKNYNLMGPVKAALESAVRYLAFELGPRNIRVNAISAGPIATRAAGGLAGFDRLLEQSQALAPLARKLGIDDVGGSAAFLLLEAAAAITGEVIHVDCGGHARGPG